MSWEVLLVGATALTVGGLILRNHGFTAVGMGLMWMGLAILGAC